MNIKFYALFFSSCMICMNLHAKEFCSSRLVIDPSVTSYLFQGHPVIAFNPGDSIDFWINLETDTDFYYQCTCAPNNPYMTHNMVDIFGMPFHITDTGWYYITSNTVVLVGDCTPRAGSIPIEVIYESSLDVRDENGINEIEVYPTVSSGLYFFRGIKNIHSIHISDISGRFVLIASEPNSIIDLTKFSAGIYYYAITDEKENIFRGRIVKE